MRSKFPLPGEHDLKRFNDSGLLGDAACGDQPADKGCWLDVKDGRTDVFFNLKDEQGDRQLSPELAVFAANLIALAQPGYLYDPDGNPQTNELGREMRDQAFYDANPAERAKLFKVIGKTGGDDFGSHLFLPSQVYEERTKFSVEEVLRLTGASQPNEGEGVDSQVSSVSAPVTVDSPEVCLTVDQMMTCAVETNDSVPVNAVSETALIWFGAGSLLTMGLVAATLAILRKKQVTVLAKQMTAGVKKFTDLSEQRAGLAADAAEQSFRAINQKTTELSHLKSTVEAAVTQALGDLATRVAEATAATEIQRASAETTHALGTAIDAATKEALQTLAKLDESTLRADGQSERNLAFSRQAIEEAVAQGVREFVVTVEGMVSSSLASIKDKGQAVIAAQEKVGSAVLAKIDSANQQAVAHISALDQRTAELNRMLTEVQETAAQYKSDREIAHLDLKKSQEDLVDAEENLRAATAELEKARVINQQIAQEAIQLKKSGEDASLAAMKANEGVVTRSNELEELEKRVTAATQELEAREEAIKARMAAMNAAFPEYEQKFVNAAEAMMDRWWELRTADAQLIVTLANDASEKAKASFNATVESLKGELVALQKRIDESDKTTKDTESGIGELKDRVSVLRANLNMLESGNFQLLHAELNRILQVDERLANQIRETLDQFKQVQKASADATGEVKKLRKDLQERRDAIGRLGDEFRDLKRSFTELQRHWNAKIDGEQNQRSRLRKKVADDLAHQERRLLNAFKGNLGSVQRSMNALREDNQNDKLKVNDLLCDVTDWVEREVNGMREQVEQKFKALTADKQVPATRSYTPRPRPPVSRRSAFVAKGDSPAQDAAQVPETPQPRKAERVVEATNVLPNDGKRWHPSIKAATQPASESVQTVAKDRGDRSKRVQSGGTQPLMRQRKPVPTLLLTYKPEATLAPVPERAHVAPLPPVIALSYDKAPTAFDFFTNARSWWASMLNTEKPTAQPLALPYIPAPTAPAVSEPQPAHASEITSHKDLMDRLYEENHTPIIDEADRLQDLIRRLRINGFEEHASVFERIDAAIVHPFSGDFPQEWVTPEMREIEERLDLLNSTSDQKAKIVLEAIEAAYAPEHEVARRANSDWLRHFVLDFIDREVAMRCGKAPVLEAFNMAHVKSPIVAEVQNARSTTFFGEIEVDTHNKSDVRIMSDIESELRFNKRYKHLAFVLDSLQAHDRELHAALDHLQPEVRAVRIAQEKLNALRKVLEKSQRMDHSELFRERYLTAKGGAPLEGAKTHRSSPLDFRAEEVARRGSKRRGNPKGFGK